MKVDTQALKLCLVTHRQNQPLNQYLDFISQAIEGGVTCVQLREKSQDSKTILALAQALQALLRPLDIPLIINDDVAVANAVGAAGVHLGPHDTSPEQARAVLGSEAWIGLSIETYDALMLANRNSHLTYVAASAVFETQTKQDCSTVWGLDGLRNFCEKSLHPVVAIGGINANNASLVKAAGVAGIAVIGAIHDAQSPKMAATALKQIWEA